MPKFKPVRRPEINSKYAGKPPEGLIEAVDLLAADQVVRKLYGPEYVARPAEAEDVTAFQA
ncbi:hypothetical protein A2841_01925 [Candidatus Kaiserbacteria bacterium RIFCSPHIGHO2_01_FULL_48_10]|uniref:Uncharacterized protein n=1 Tax=Candidatus Kaiserbacteria bacterium RIFCSPHIGHO2_01_FULL_48_10 TaxID=1798476 RepID=A0A1F6C6E4_9BACT|nr:MAG: hypothetical protein A2841_01925 [Candidatus Kaiserbacteria bacterium RIFCSPHIGHO2_01_FULL_48_10]HLC99950.1 hypothetical protein [Patescibacteria group bacterium]